MFKTFLKPDHVIFFLLLSLFLLKRKLKEEKKIYI